MPRGQLTESQMIQRQKLLKRIAKGTTIASEDIEKMSEAKKKIVGKTFSLYASYGEFQKANKEKRLVKGIASNEAIDCYGDIVRFEAMKEAFDDYMEFGNIREMHGNSAVGTVKEYEFDEDTKSTIITAKIVDDSAWEKVVEGVYKGFSIGGRVIEAEPLMIKTYDDNGDEYEVWSGGMDITKLELVEISVVDRPANPDALIESYKAQNVSKEGGFIPDLAFISKEIKQTDSLVKFLSPKADKVMFEKVWNNIVDFFKKNQDVNLEEMKDDDAKVSITKAELYDLVKSFVSKAVEESESKDEETPAEEEKDDENKEVEEKTPAEETPEATEDKATEDAPAEEVAEKSEDAEEVKAEEPAQDEAEEKAEEKPAEEPAKEGEDVAKMISAGFEKMQSELLKKFDAQDAKIENLEKSFKERDVSINEMLKKAGFSTQKDAPVKEQSIFKGILNVR